ncbi:MAG: MotA/TolQ/ExbB proton channel family protein [Pseudomonadales bacterium]|nr:MotA/TolQ/ExbB proton channel family protein [Pseudomonadales bacterium]
MWFLVEGMQISREFVLAGGPVLMSIAFLTWFMWTLLLERLWYLNFTFPKLVQKTVNEWNQRSEFKSWYAHQIRHSLIAGLAAKARFSIPIIKTSVALCPMLGLLGTVSGAIEVFDVMAAFGTGNTRSMAAGVSKATIPTMAGMVSALSGLITITLVARKAERETERLALNLKIEN